MENCDKDIFEKGEIVGTLVGVIGTFNIEREVKKVAGLGFKVDWQYIRGEHIIKTTSDLDRVRAAFVANNHTLRRP